MNTKEKMKDFITQFDLHFNNAITTVLDEQKNFHSSEVFLDEKLEESLLKYAQNGKRVRPYIIHLLSGKTLTDTDVFNTTVSVELFHLMALIHDDIMDQSTVRRGVPTIHTAVSSYCHNNTHLGEGIALLLGDSFLIESLRYAQKVTTEIFEEISLILQRTVRGQYLDVLGMDTRLAENEKNIVYDREYLKTAWYTFAGPAKLGLLLNDTKYTNLEIEKIVEVYIELGLLFQIRDDIIDCDPQRKDKTPFEDIREGKTTWVSLFLKERYPEKYQDIINAKVHDNFAAIAEVFATVDLSGEYQKEFARCETLIETIRHDAEVYKKTVSILELLKLPS